MTGDKRFDLLASLVDRSLVLSEAHGDVSRYRLLESMRVYAREKLLAGGEWEECSHRHARYLRDLFAKARLRYEQTTRRVELDELLATELEEVRTALDRSANGVDAVLGPELFAASSLGWGKLGLYSDCITRRSHASKPCRSSCRIRVAPARDSRRRQRR